MEKLAIIVSTPPSSPMSITAIDFIKAALDNGISITGVFFYQDGVLHANSLTSIPNDEYQCINHWLELNSKYKIPLHICITAAEKRGMTDDDELHNINECFTVSGLGELVEINNIADRVVQL